MSSLYWFQIFAAVNALMVTLLAFNISRLRITEKVANGDGGNLKIKKAIRTHMNGVEHVPIFGLALLALDFSPAPDVLLAALVIGFTSARIVHAIGMLTIFFNGRRIGAGVTYLCEFIAMLAIVPYVIMV